MEYIIVFLFSLQLLPETFLIIRRIQRDIIINVHTYLCEVTVFLSYFSQSFEKSTCIKFFQILSSGR